MNVPLEEIESIVQHALLEDIGSGDITAALLTPEHKSTAELIVREQAILCGCAWFDMAFKQLDPEVAIDWLTEDKATITAGQILCTITGSSRSLLSVERTAINFLQTLSGTATTVASYVNLIKGTGAQILDTRKTIPGLRKAQKYAVYCGGGKNHRTGLYDAFLIKENHIAAQNDIITAVKKAKRQDLPVIVEVENSDEIEQALSAGADRILLDNFNLEEIRRAVRLVNGRTEIEVSGNVNQDNVRALAETGINYISIGALTKHIRAVDFSISFV